MCDGFGLDFVTSRRPPHFPIVGNREQEATAWPVESRLEAARGPAMEDVEREPPIRTAGDDVPSRSHHSTHFTREREAIPETVLADHVTVADYTDMRKDASAKGPIE